MTIVKKLASLSIFCDIPEQDIQRFANQCTTIQYDADTCVCTQGEQADGAVLLIEGSLVVTLHTATQNRIVGMIGPGEIFGEQGLFYSQETRSATVTAKEDSVGIVLTPQLMREQAASPVMVALECHLIMSLSKRIRNTNTQFQEAWQRDTNTAKDTFVVAPPTLLERLKAIFIRS